MGGTMSDEKKVFVERRPEGDHAIRKPNAERASALEHTQAEVIERAREMKPGSSVHAGRAVAQPRGSGVPGRRRAAGPRPVRRERPKSLSSDA